MKIEYSNDYTPNVDVLIRVYESQDLNATEDKLFAGEILFANGINKLSVRFTAPYPRGLAEAIKRHVTELREIESIRVSNELPNDVAHLTSCRENFDIRFRREVEPLLRQAKQT